MLLLDVDCVLTDGKVVVKRYADYVTTHRAGQRAAREVMEYIFNNAGGCRRLLKKVFAVTPK